MKNPFPIAHLCRRALASLLAVLLAATQTLAQNAAPALREGYPALWRVADADTTIFLFGTVHALPKDAVWLRGTVASALLTSDTLVTEVLPGTLTDAGFLVRYAATARLPEGETLRGLLEPGERARLEAALAANGLKPEQLDPFKPWFAANTLVLAPLLKQGYTAAAGSEESIETYAGEEVKRIGLETGDQQVAYFDGLPRKVQVAYLMNVVDQLGTVEHRVDRTVAAWLAGDVATVAAESEAKEDDPRMAEALLYPRNRAWADWIAARLATPGRVFIAVGAGHLAGPRSVQAALAEKGIAVRRLQ